jgi:ATP-binding cassette subfamily B (MDR/TAP) protein 1
MGDTKTMSPVKEKKKETTKGKKEKAEKEDKDVPTVSFLYMLSFYPTLKSKILFVIGLFGAVANGCAFPVLAYMFSKTFSDLAGVNVDMAKIREIAYQFVGIGVACLIAGTVQTFCLELAADRAIRNFRRIWFKALLRQDAAYFDVNEVGGIASSIGSKTKKVKRGLGLKLGEGVQFATTAIGGIGYSLYSSWKITLVLFAVLPVVGLTGALLMKTNQTKSSRSAASYETAGSVVYSTVSGIRTVLSLNAAPEMVENYKKATAEAYNSFVSSLFGEGFINGSMLGSFMGLYAVLTVFGSFLIYDEVRKNGCDPSNAVPGVEVCAESGPAVFGALLGAAFGGQGVSQLGNVIGILAEARSAMYSAMEVINRKVGSAAEEIMVDNFKDDDSNTFENLEDGDTTKRMVRLPEYKIDSSSTEGLKPKNIEGAIQFKDVHFSYPTRPESAIFKGLNLDIKAGTTVAIVGPSGSGKSTTVSLIERFYDPTSGTVSLDGNDLTKINVSYLRSLVGYVGQEPTLFATTIAGNIRYGKPDATQKEIEEAARLANAHDFIMSFPEKYETQVGDKGSQLSGGQKQRIAIARVLVSNPKVLLLDEATSALDAESELIVQEALDNMLQASDRTTIIIAHRLSTIRDADVIAVVADGELVEQGSHEELVNNETGHYRNLLRMQSSVPSRTDSQNDLNKNMGDSSHGNLQLLDDTILQSEALSSENFIEFDCVKFAYPTRPDKLIMNKFCLSIRRGETIALVGPSGGGKSTVMSMIERFYDPNDGVVRLQGYDLRDLNVSSLRDQIGLVAQEPILFNMSIYDNVKMGFPEATKDDVIQALKLANAYEFVESFAESLNTQVGEKGTQLSGGQKQRIAIARAIVKRPDILLLDEATSALDTGSEVVVQEALDNIIQNTATTTVMIAHRLSTVRNADRIAFVARGKVLEIGSHEELMQKPNGRFRRLVESQNRNARANVNLKQIIDSAANDLKHDEDDDSSTEDDDKEDAVKSFDAAYARSLARPDLKFFIIGLVGTVLASLVFPAWGVMFAQMIKQLFRVVLPCGESLVPNGFTSCQAYYDSVADSMRTRSFELGGYWLLLVGSCLVGNIILFLGFGTAQARLDKRIRDSAFASLVRQEITFFDKRSVGSISSQLQDDATKLQTFTGDPLRDITFALCSVIVGIAISFIYMWPFALVSLGTIPFMVRQTLFFMHWEVIMARRLIYIMYNKTFSASFAQRLSPRLLR